MIVLNFGDWRATIEPELGGSILSLTFRGQPVLRPTNAVGDVRATACYPTIPYANRIAHGKFSWGGKTYKLPFNTPSSPHPIHGVGWRQPWSVGQQGESACDLLLDFKPDNEWPFPFAAKQRIALGATGLSVRVTLTNKALQDAPLGFGFHPFFVARGGDRINFTAKGIYKNSADLLPDGFIAKGPGWDLKVDERPLDNDFGDWGGEALITADKGPTFLLVADMPMLRIYTPVKQPYFAVEPVSHGADAINRGGMPPIKPGESVTGRMVISAVA